ncbi:hypothetical protein PR202_gb08545 [Eleusine coracana subsp. coracana]|uniref:Uncharacterized protein n=1 Tax=Eleusine coracana subsp. coracana TaxID=191504 RepID=A0AAV5EEV6_ELECO|nr:hypothetical protein PR202_gb08545 [Eleusine coracana subsp. coracana]
MAPPRAAGTGAPSRQLLRAAADGDLRLFKSKCAPRAPPLPFAGFPCSIALSYARSRADVGALLIHTVGIARALDGGKGCIREAVEAVGDRGAGVLHLAAGSGRIPVCAYLVEELHVDVNAVDESGDAPLAHAVRGCKVDTVRYLLDHGADPNKPGEHGCTTLHVAAGARMCEIIQVLLSKGADVDSFSYCGTPLHAAIIGKQDAALKVLLDNHADCNKALSIYYTPLIAALHVHLLKCVKLLIKAGADVKGVGQLTPLIAAANVGLTDFYKCLLEAGADPNVCDDDDPLYKMGPDYLKSEGSKAYKRKDYVSAVNFYSMLSFL